MTHYYNGLDDSFAQIEQPEMALITRLINGLKQIEKVTIYGITDDDRMPERIPTVPTPTAYSLRYSAPPRLVVRRIF